jgi:membrane associated rhomboid family serine protease
MSSTPTTNEQENPRLTPAVQTFIAISIAVMFVQTAVGLSDMSAWLGFDAGRLPSRWWTAFTYMFVHGSVVHLLANVYPLYLFGPRLERYWAGERKAGAKRFTWFYLLCGLGGVVFELLFMRGDSPMIGASAAVFGVMTAYAMQWPEDEVYFFFVVPVRARTLAVGLLVFNLVLGVTTTGATGMNIAYCAHLGGVIAAYIYMRMSSSGGMEQVQQRVANVPDADEPPRAIPRNLPRRDRGDEVDDIVAKSRAIAGKRAVSISPKSRRGEARADELNRVLDKISQHGIESLTTDERKVLEEMSKRLRGS